jgi:hypothetical protein
MGLHDAQMIHQADQVTCHQIDRVLGGSATAAGATVIVKDDREMLGECLTLRAPVTGRAS